MSSKTYLSLKHYTHRRYAINVLSENIQPRRKLGLIFYAMHTICKNNIQNLAFNHLTYAIYCVKMFL